MQLSRERAALMGEETRRILAERRYATTTGEVVELGAQLDLALHEHSALVLGAWGCGVFRNDPAEVAGLFADALAGPFHGAFAEVVFAVLDSSPERRFIGPFERALG